MVRVCVFLNYVKCHSFSCKICDAGMLSIKERYQNKAYEKGCVFTIIGAAFGGYHLL